MGKYEIVFTKRTMVEFPFENSWTVFQEISKQKAFETSTS